MEPQTALIAELHRQLIHLLGDALEAWDDDTFSLGERWELGDHILALLRTFLQAARQFEPSQRVALLARLRHATLVFAEDEYARNERDPVP